MHPSPTLAAAASPSLPSSNQPGPPRTLALDLSDEPDALMRVLAQLHRRRCEILSVNYDAGQRRRPRLTVQIRHLGGRPDALEAGLRGTIGVLGVVTAA